LNLFGLIGHPLGHSFSKAYFTAKFEREGLDCEYRNFDIPSLGETPASGTSLRALAKQSMLSGFNVTIPYKEAILPYLDELDPAAKEIGAVNTVKVLPDGRLKGYNTDVVGFESSWIATLRKAPLAMTTTALILGTGGASKAVQYVLKKNNIPYHLVSRDAIKGDFTYDQLTPDIIKERLLVINTTPVGMSPNIDAAPDIPYEAISDKHALIDLIYNPEETLFLKNGREHGAATTNGLTMLHAQAEASWKIWNS
jgi:shikimate dehydrogenase